MDNTNLTPILSNPYTLSPATEEETAKVLEHYEKTGRPLPGFLVKDYEVYRITYPGEVTPEAEFSPGLEYVNDKVAPLVPGPGEVIVGGEDGPVALDVSEISGDANFITSVGNTATISLSVDSGELAADVIANYAAESHTHAQADVEGLEDALAGKADAEHTHSEADVEGLTAALAGKANTSHTHSIGQVTDLQDELDGKAATSHTHSEGDITGLSDRLSAIEARLDALEEPEA